MGSVRRFKIRVGEKEPVTPPPPPLLHASWVAGRCHQWSLNVSEADDRWGHSENACVWVTLPCGCCCRGCFRGRCRGRCHGCCRRPVLLFIDFHYIFLLFFFPFVDPFGVIFLKKKYQKKAFFESKTIFVSYQNHSKPVQCWACIFWMYGRKFFLPNI